MQNSPRNTNSALPVINGDRLFLESKKIRQDKTRQDKTRQDKFYIFTKKKGFRCFKATPSCVKRRKEGICLLMPRKRMGCFDFCALDAVLYAFAAQYKLVAHLPAACLLA
jgi:hypothetical protein